ncbi:MAG: hypothetical protein DRJ44_05940 [Thermoprotei archaeon]|nr:MAG: hypothetical protein DRJ44_05940 [Thermoprotei archaeon]
MDISDGGAEYSVKEYLESIASELEEYLVVFIKKNFSEELADIVKYATSGGKKLRGTLLVLMGEILGGDRRELMDLACAMEITHSASLIRDDIIDGSKVRRGKEAVWIRYGLDIALILPHIMVSTGVLTIARKGGWLARLAVDAWRRASLGQFLDILYSRDGVERKVTYDEIIGLKTGSLFEAACFIGAGAVAGVEAARVAGVYGYNIGCAYQVVDDIVGLLLGKEESGSAKALEAKGDIWKVGLKLTASYVEQAVFAADSLQRFASMDTSILKKIPAVIVKNMAKEVGGDLEKVLDAILESGVLEGRADLDNL